MGQRSGEYQNGSSHWTTQSVHQSVPMMPKDPSEMRPAGKHAYHLGRSLPTSCSSILSNAPSPASAASPSPYAPKRTNQDSSVHDQENASRMPLRQGEERGPAHQSVAAFLGYNKIYLTREQEDKNSVRGLIGPDRGWGDTRDATGLRESLHRRRQKSEEVSVKIGARVCGGSYPSRSQLNTIQDTIERKESVIKRQQYDAVQDLLSQDHRGELYRSNSARAGARKGPFRYTVDKNENQWTIDVELPHGTLSKALRNQHRHCLIFEGQVSQNCKRNPPQVNQETLEIAVPAEFDHMSENLQVIKKFSEGRCSVHVPRRKQES